MRRTILGLVLFATAFGYVEATVVVYLRTVVEPLRQQLTPGTPADDLFPLLSQDQLNREAPRVSRLISVELAREAATIVMLASAALAAAPWGTRWLGAFALVFGVWDITFYLFLKILIDWPQSVWTWDLLFLIPLPWTSPVLAPVLVSLALAGCGTAALSRGVHFRRTHWAALILGAAFILLSFFTNARAVLAGAAPQSYNWWFFSAGEIAGLIAFLHAFRSSVKVKSLQSGRLSR